jgi:hypothetical protein
MEGMLFGQEMIVWNLRICVEDVLIFSESPSLT